jgi:DNA-binding PadR family transcriptional regulator
MLSNELTKGTLKTILLKLLDEEGKMYGYEITQHVKTLSDGKMILTEGALYPTLHKLEAEGLVKTKQIMVGKRMRKYYTLTAKGKKANKNKLAEFQEFINAMQLILKPKTTSS